MINFGTEFEDVCAKKFESDSKIGVLCSVAPDGYPHMALISSISVKNKKSLMWGQFSQGLSKEYLKQNPKTGFLVVSLDQYWWTGKSLHTGSAVKGEDFDYFNNKPLFRYNSYCGFGAVHYGDIVDVSAGEKLPILKIALGSVTSKMLKGKIKNELKKNAPGPFIEKLSSYGMNLGSRLMTLKFVAYIDSDGFPRIIPALQGLPVDSEHFVFAASPYGELLDKIPPGSKASVFLASLDLECLLIQGRWQGVKKYGGGRGAVLDIDKVYNSMLPLAHYIYPPLELPNVYGRV
ncbi:MAG: hypothetical protein LBN21_12745 [Treponema sp.]|jgi:hypothetical protein|nr:hypothetical protein [Treponema sp.]